MYPGRDDPFWRDRQQQAAPASAFDLPRLSAGFSTAPLSNLPSLGPFRPAAPLASDVAARAPFYGQSSLTNLSTDPFQRTDALRSYRSMNFDGSAFGPPSMHSNHGSHALRPFEERQDRRAMASGYGDLLDVRDRSDDLPRGSGSRVNCVCGSVDASGRLIGCQLCGRLSHAACVTVDGAPSQGYICNRCSAGSSLGGGMHRPGLHGQSAASASRTQSTKSSGLDLLGPLPPLRLSAQLGGQSGLVPAVSQRAPISSTDLLSRVGGSTFEGTGLGSSTERRTALHRRPSSPSLLGSSSMGGLDLRLPPLGSLPGLPALGALPPLGSGRSTLKPLNMNASSGSGLSAVGSSDSLDAMLGSKALIDRLRLRDTRYQDDEPGALYFKSKDDILRVGKVKLAESHANAPFEQKATANLFTITCRNHRSPWSQQKGTHCPWELQFEKISQPNGGETVWRLQPSSIVPIHNSACRWKLDNPGRPMQQSPYFEQLKAIGQSSKSADRLPAMPPLLAPSSSFPSLGSFSQFADISAAPNLVHGAPAAVAVNTTAPKLSKAGGRKFQPRCSRGLGKVSPSRPRVKSAPYFKSKVVRVKAAELPYPKLHAAALPERFDPRITKSVSLADAVHPTKFLGSVASSSMPGAHRMPRSLRDPEPFMHVATDRLGDVRKERTAPHSKQHAPLPYLRRPFGSTPASMVISGGCDDGDQTSDATISENGDGMVPAWERVTAVSWSHLPVAPLLCHPESATRTTVAPPPMAKRMAVWTMDHPKRRRRYPHVSSPKSTGNTLLL